MAKRRFRSRRKSFGQRGPRRTLDWASYAIGSQDAFLNNSCPFFIPGHAQLPIPVLVEEQYGGFDPANPTEPPFQRERVTALRCIAELQLFAVVTAEDFVPVPFRWAMGKYDTDEVISPTLQFNSLFTSEFWLNERILMSGEGNLSGVPVITNVGQSWPLFHNIKIDQRLSTSLETGSGIYILLEVGACDIGGAEVGGQGVAVLGYTRALFRE